MISLLSRSHCYHGPTVVTIPLLSRSHCCHDPIVVTISLLTRSHCYNYPVVITVSLLLLPNSYHDRFVFTNPLHFLRRITCLKPSQGIPTCIPSCQIWSKYGDNAVKMQEEQRAKQTYIYFSFYRQRSPVGNATLGKALLPPYSGQNCTSLSSKTLTNFHPTIRRYISKRKKLVSVRTSNSIRKSQFASRAFSYPDRVAENIIFHVSLAETIRIPQSEILLQRTSLCIAYEYMLQQVTRRPLRTAFCITVQDTRQQVTLATQLLDTCPGRDGSMSHPLNCHGGSGAKDKKAERDFKDNTSRRIHLNALVL